MVIDTILTLGAPYPEDQRYDSSELRSELRFRVQKGNDTRDYEILDRLTDDQAAPPVRYYNDKAKTALPNPL